MVLVKRCLRGFYRFSESAWKPAGNGVKTVRKFLVKDVFTAPKTPFLRFLLFLILFLPSYRQAG